MQFLQADHSLEKGWYVGPWNSDLPISVGYACKGIDEPHLHTQITEIYLVARGTAELRTEAGTFTLRPGAMVILQPGEAHTFLSSSPDYLHFVIHTPGFSGETARLEKQPVAREFLGL